MAVKTRIIRIGNSRGVRIPKVLLDQSGISGEVELEVVQNGIVIHAVSHPPRRLGRGICVSGRAW
jgi:antitoxin MazE